MQHNDCYADMLGVNYVHKRDMNNTTTLTGSGARNKILQDQH